MAKGGKRPGAGRPKGSTTRPQLRDHFTRQDVEQLVADLKKRAETDSSILKFLGEQIFGKAPQPLTGEDGESIAVVGFNFLKHERNTADDPTNG
jgi:hypothetical protein